MSIALTTFTGCSKVVILPDTTMTMRQSYDELDAFLVLIATLVPGEWRDVGSGVRPCRLPSGTQGLFYLAGSVGPGIPSEKQLEIAQTVDAAFKKSGIPTMQGVLAFSRPGDRITQLRSTTTISHDHVQYVSLNIAIVATTFEGKSRCVAGDPWGPNEPWDSAHPSVAPE